jgi:hypothetical protein
VAKASPLVPAREPTASLFARPGAKWAIGACLVIAVITGWFAWQAIRHRQDIATPGAAPEDSLPAPSMAAQEPANVAPRSSAVATAQAKPAPAVPSASSVARARPAASSEPRKPAVDAHARPRDVAAPKDSASRPPETKPRQK